MFHDKCCSRVCGFATLCSGFEGTLEYMASLASGVAAEIGLLPKAVVLQFVLDSVMGAVPLSMYPANVLLSTRLPIIRPTCVLFSSPAES